MAQAHVRRACSVRAALALFGALLSLGMASPAFAFKLFRNSSNSVPHWEKPSVRYRVVYDLAPPEPASSQQSAPLGERIAERVTTRGGYDHNFALDTGGDPRVLAARLEAPRSGRTLEIRTTQPALQLYTGNFLGGDLRCRNGARPGRWHAVCLETQAFPNAPNEPGFPPVRLDPGQVYRHTTVYRFGTC